MNLWVGSDHKHTSHFTHPKQSQKKTHTQVDLAFNGQEAVDKACVHKYDLIFMDMMMPVMDGLTVCCYITLVLVMILKYSTNHLPTLGQFFLRLCLVFMDMIMPVMDSSV